MGFVRVLLACSLLAVLAGAGPAVGRSLPPTGFQTGAPFPDLPLPALDGTSAFSVGDVSGRKLVLHVFASW